VPLTATITTTVIANPTALASIPVTVTFSEPVVFTAGQLTLGNGGASAFAGGPTVYTFTLAAQAPETQTTVAIGIGVFDDAVGEPERRRSGDPQPHLRRLRAIGE
jgi:3-deoxy-D-manno-octulosonic acid (KDO) 8-phosphate synthase